MSDVEQRSASLPARRREELPLTVVSEGDVLVGRLAMAGNGQVLGSFDGDVTCAGELLIGSEARVRADIEAHDLVLAGHVHGNVVVRGRLKITTTGKLEGDAHVGSLIVQEGGVHFGVLRVYPDGLPERPRESVAELAVVARPATGSRTRPLAASVERVKKMWGEIF
ncbi:MAG TPA: polymer-forming cytoskeletal protein [Candidatus Dormibacteraeota bacterium]|nr:polymer-forming cytoskeletal protein [Candidatus Dormibacteraeota bacterium]